MNRILVPAVPPPGGEVRVDPAASHHLLRVQRVARGARVRVADGAGALAEAELVGVEDGEAVLRVIVPLAARPAPVRVVVLGVPRPALLEEALTLGTEGGATRFLLVSARRTPPGTVRPDRLERVLRAAVTQCGRPDLPAVAGPMGLAAALAAVPEGARVLADQGGDPPRGTEGPATVAVGPEGGWDAGERAALLEAGFVPTGLGPWTLRAPSAVGAALAALWPG